jgi:hypothetical protein
VARSHAIAIGWALPATSIRPILAACKKKRARHHRHASLIGFLRQNRDDWPR